MKNPLKLTALLVALLMSTTLFAQSYSGGSGTSELPYEIANKADLKYLSENTGEWSKHFKQTADITFETSDFQDGGDFYNGGEGFSPIGNSTVRFTGSYDGDNHKITGLYINRPAGNRIGFFGYIKETEIDNLGIVNCDIVGNDWIAAIAGRAEQSNITNCYATGSIAAHDKVGGIVGQYRAGGQFTFSIINCYNKCTVSGTDDYVGGLVGSSPATNPGYISIENCYNEGSVTAAESYVGGLVGNGRRTSFSNCYNEGTVTGDNSVGGLVGYFSDGSINSCYSIGAVSGTGGYRIGGLAGYVGYSSVSNCYSTGSVSGASGDKVGGLVGLIYSTSSTISTINKCYSTGLVSSTGSEVGGLVGGTEDGGEINNSFWDTETSGQTTSIGGTGKTTSEMKDVETFTNTATLGLDEAWDFTNDWQILSNSNSSPYLQDPAQSPPPGYNTFTWDGSENSDWNTQANWDENTIPGSSDNVIVSDAGNAIVITSGTGASCNNLTLNASASLTVNSGGSLITNGTIINNGTIDVKREISDDQWHLISAPNSVTTANTFLGDYLQTWNESTASWSDITEPTTALNPLQGYSLWGVAKATTHTFSGNPNTGNQSIALSYTAVAGGVNDGANLLGNPYPSSIDWADLDDTWGAVYYWNGTQYATWNDGSGTNGGVQFIPPMQGFFIVAGSSGTFELTNENRTHSGATTYFKSTENIVSNSLLLEAKSEDKSDELFIRIDPNSSNSFELQEDAYKMLSSTVGLPQLYSFSDENILSIDARPETDIIQLGFQNDVAGDYSIGIKEISDISQLILEDTKTGAMHNLQNGNYEFAWELSDDEKRFKLHLEANDIETLSEDLFNIYANNKILFVKTDKTIEDGLIKVVDILGRVVIEQEIRNSDNIQISTNLDTGIYIVVVKDGNKVGSEKVLIK